MFSHSFSHTSSRMFWSHKISTPYQMLLLTPHLERHRTTLLNVLLYSMKVFESIRVSVEKELQSLNHNLSFHSDPGLNRDRPRSALRKHGRGPDHDSSIAATAQKSFDDCCSSVCSGEGDISSGTEPDLDGDPVNESFSSSSRSISLSLPASVSVRASMTSAHPSHDTGAPEAESAPHTIPLVAGSAVSLPHAQAAVQSPISTSTCASVAEEVQRLRTLQVSSPPTLSPSFLSPPSFIPFCSSCIYPSPLFPSSHSIPLHPSYICLSSLLLFTSRLGRIVRVSYNLCRLWSLR